MNQGDPISDSDVLACLRQDDGGTLEAIKAEGWRLVHAARQATGPAVEHARSAAETWFWQHTVDLLGPPPSQGGAPK
jgi:hypothetical protein